MRSKSKVQDLMAWWITLNTALVRWQKIIQKRESTEYFAGDWDAFAKFLDPEANAALLVDGTNEELLRKVKTVAGPHGVSILRAMDIRARANESK